MTCSHALRAFLRAVLQEDELKRSSFTFSQFYVVSNYSNSNPQGIQ